MMFTQLMGHTSLGQFKSASLELLQKGAVFSLSLFFQMCKAPSSSHTQYTKS